jgi:hypothetical protein
VTVTDVGPSELLDETPPPGFHYEWHPMRDRRVATEEEQATRQCRRPRCHGVPVMALERRNGWWLYCYRHLYGSRIRNGVVEFRRLVPDEAP